MASSISSKDHTTANCKQRETGHPHIATSIFAVGYLAARAGFSLVAVILQWG